MSTNEQYEEPLKHIVSIGSHEKGMKNAFSSPLTMKCNVFCASKNNIPRGKQVKILTFAYGQAGTPPYSQPARKIPVFLTASLRDI